MSTIDEQLQQYGQWLTNRQRVPDITAPGALPDMAPPGPAPRRSHRRWLVVGAAAAIVVVLLGVVVVRARAPQPEALTVTTPAETNALGQLRAAVDATAHATGFTATISAADPNGVQVVYQAPDRTHTRQPFQGLPGLPAGDLETITIGSTQWTKQPGIPGWSRWDPPAVPPVPLQMLDVVRQADTAVLEGQEIHWSGPAVSGTATIVDGHVASATIDFRDPAHPRTDRIQISSVGSSPPVDPPPADQVGTSGTLPRCDEPRPPEIPICLNDGPR